MLLSLTLKNFILIECLELSFHRGLTAITGETGAGKSILIDAIELALGAKVTTDIIKVGHERAEITVVFDIKNLIAAQQWLSEHELEVENDDCILRRTFSREGKSRCFINQTPVSISQLIEFSEHLIQICGQHAHHNLLKSSYQRELLDHYADQIQVHSSAKSMVLKIKQLAYTIQHLEKEIAAFENQHQEAERKRDFLEFQLKDFQQIKPKQQEFEKLESEFKRLNQSGRLLQDCQKAYEVLIGENSSFAIISSLHLALRSLEPYLDLYPELKNSYDLLASAEIQVNEAASEIDAHLQKVDLNPEHLQQIESRMGELHSLARKYRIQPEQLHEFQQQLEQELAAENQLASLAELKQQLTSLQQEYDDVAVKLSQARQQAAKQLEKNIEKQLHRLGMNNVQMHIELQLLPENVRKATGREDIHFLARTNEGQSFQAIAKIASGGELSRISLALQTVLTAGQLCPLLFDEVDVGIGGKTAGIVGQMLRELGGQTQVIAITHLPQVAAYAHHHLNVAKETIKGQTQSTLSYLSSEQRVEELSRMLGGIEITDSTRQHAKEMLTMAAEV